MLKPDLTDTELFVSGDPHRVFSQLREEDPVYWNAEGSNGGFWALTKYEDIAAAYLDHATFSSSAGAMMGGSLHKEGDSASGEMLVASDPPRHRLIRKALRPAFSAQMLTRIRAQVDQLLAKAMAQARAAGGCDIAEEVAPMLPIGALMVTLGIGQADAARLLLLTRQMIGIKDEHYRLGALAFEAQLAKTQAEIFVFFADLLGARRDGKGEDLVSLLCRARINGRPLSDAEVLYNCMNVAVGGNETSSYSLCGGVQALLQFPEQAVRLQGDPVLRTRAVDEVLRWTSTNAYVQRRAMRDIEIRGKRIRSGDFVTLWNLSANRDSERFSRPDHFDISRSPNPHVSYGHGVHRCIGSSVGTAELECGLGHIFPPGSQMRIAGDVRRLRSNFILGFTKLPVEFA